MKKDKTLIAKESLYKTLRRVALPIAVQSLIAASLNLVDNLMVGKLGDTELTAVGLSTQFFFVFWMVLFGFNGGTSTYIAQFWGKGDIIGIRRVTGIAVSASFLVGILFFCAAAFFPHVVLGIFTDNQAVLALGIDFVRYGSVIFLAWSVVVPLTAVLKATQQTSLPLKISIAVFGTNTVLCLILIFGLFGFPRLGVMGACVATVTSRILELILYIIVIFGRKNIVAGPLREFFSWDRILIRRVFANAIPTTLNEAFWGIGTSLYNAAYGRVGTGIVEFAAVQAGNTILNLFALVCFSIGDAMLILVGEQLGKGDLKEGDRLAGRILRIAVLLGLIAGGLLLALSRFIIQLFDHFTPEGLRYTQLILIIYGVVLVFKIFNGAMITGVLRAGGDTRFAMFAEMGTVWLYGVPVVFILALWIQWPIYLIVLCVQCEEVIKAIILFHRYRSKKWLKNLVHDLGEETDDRT